jgi:hypothetical protein
MRRQGQRCCGGGRQGPAVLCRVSKPPPVGSSHGRGGGRAAAAATSAVIDVSFLLSPGQLPWGRALLHSKQLLLVAGTCGRHGSARPAAEAAGPLRPSLVKLRDGGQRLLRCQRGLAALRVSGRRGAGQRLRGRGGRRGGRRRRRCCRRGKGRREGRRGRHWRWLPGLGLRGQQVRYDTWSDDGSEFCSTGADCPLSAPC